MGAFNPIFLLASASAWACIGALAMSACEAGAQTYTHQVDPAQYDNGPTSIPYPELDMNGQPLSILHAKSQFHSGMIPAFHNGLVSNGFLAGPGFGVIDTPLCDGTLWGNELDWSHGHFGVQDCIGPCQVMPVRWMKCDSQPPGVPLGPLQFRDAHVYMQTSNLCETCPRAPLLYGISQYGPSTGLRDGGPSQHSGPILREILRPNSGGQMMVWGSNLSNDPSAARIRVAGWEWDGTSHLLLDQDIPDWPTVNPAIAVTWPEGVDLQFIVVDGAFDAGSWFAGDLQFNAVPEPGSLAMLLSGMALIWRLRR